MNGVAYHVQNMIYINRNPKPAGVLLATLYVQVDELSADIL